MPEPQSTSPDNLIGCTLHHGEYSIQRILGHGGMGKVYLATHTSLGTRFAIKQARADQPLPDNVTAELDAILRGQRSGSSEETDSEGDFPTSGGIHTDRFLREALLLARLEHPAIPTLYDYFAQDGYWYLVMDYIPGPTLGVYLRQQQQQPIPALEALNYAMQLCDVLDYLHRQSPPIVFRDMKPSNIILTPERALMLVDFGISRYFKVGQVNDTIEFGSPGYAPPEQYQGHAQTDARSDLYSLGVLLHEMVTGKRPASMGTPLSPPQSLNSSLSASVSGLIALATRSEPMYRFQSAQALYMALERVYTIEEWRTYQQQLYQDNEQREATTSARASVSGIKFEQTALTSTAQSGEKTAIEGETPRILPSRPPTTPPPSSPWSLQQRHAIRQSIQQTHRKQREQSSPTTPPEGQSTATPAISIRKDETTSATQAPTRPTTPRSERVVQICFALAMVVFLILSSVFTVIHIQHAGNTPHSPQSSAAANPAPQLWKALPSLPAPEADNASAYMLVKGRPYVYVSGGFRSHKQNPRYDHNLYRYDILSARWETVNGHFPGMLNNAMTTDNQDHLFFTAGYSTDSYNVVSALYIYQPDSNSLRKETPPDLIGYGGSMIADDHGHLYISQGFMQAGQPNTQAAAGWYRYDIAADQWQSLAPLPQGLGYTVLAFDRGGGILMLGGAGDAGQHNQSDQIYRYDIARDSWKQLPATMPQPLSGSANCMATANQAIIIGGYDAQNNRGLAQTWLLDLTTLHWTALPPVPNGGSALGTAACDGKDTIFAERGGDNVNQPTQDFWQITLPPVG